VIKVRKTTTNLLNSLLQSQKPSIKKFLQRKRGNAPKGREWGVGVGVGCGEGNNARSSTGKKRYQTA
jgi:hypothetical protein